MIKLIIGIAIGIIIGAIAKPSGKLLVSAYWKIKEKWFK